MRVTVAQPITFYKIDKLFEFDFGGSLSKMKRILDFLLKQKRGF